MLDSELSLIEELVHILSLKLGMNLLVVFNKPLDSPPLGLGIGWMD